MILDTDDVMYDQEGVYLGPPGHTLPWQARYSAWAVFVIVLATIELVEYQAGLTNPLFITYTLVGAVLATRRLMKFVDFDRPPSTVVAGFIHELTGTREKTRGATTTLRITNIKRKAIR